MKLYSADTERATGRTADAGWTVIRVGAVLVGCVHRLLASVLPGASANADPKEPGCTAMRPEPPVAQGAAAPHSSVDPVQRFVGALVSFRACFSRAATYRWFIVVMVGFVIRQDFLGASSFVRWLELPEATYPLLINFFHSTAWTLDCLMLTWWAWLEQNAPLIRVNSRVVWIGDHLKMPKEGRQMPEVRTMKDNSETSSKPSYFRGHHWSFLCALIGRGDKLFATPFRAGLQLRRDDVEAVQQDMSHPTRLVHLALSMAVAAGVPAYLILDAAFASGSVLDLANSVWSVDLRAPLLHIITRVKFNSVGFLPPEKPAKRKRGRPRKYGRKVRLADLFQDASEIFLKANCRVYGKVEEVRYLCLDLLWKPIGRTVRFVLLKTKRGSIILLTTDLQLDPLMVIEMYCWRTKIETAFLAFKHALGGLDYHFWSKYLQPESRRPRKNSSEPRFDLALLSKIQATTAAIERFVNLAAITLGLLQVIALESHSSLLDRMNRIWMRTYSSEVPSERIVKQMLAMELQQNTRRVSNDAALRIIHDVRNQAAQQLDKAA